MDFLKYIKYNLFIIYSKIYFFPAFKSTNITKEFLIRLN